MSKPVVGRFAPTPSGRMHLGNVFAALLCWLSARAQGGTLLLRIEDLDPQRTSSTFTKELLEDLAWLGLDWDVCAPAAGFFAPGSGGGGRFGKLPRVPGGDVFLPVGGAGNRERMGNGEGADNRAGTQNAENARNAAHLPELLPEDGLPVLCHQSRRTAFYEACLAKLAAKGLVYPCFCSRAELHAAEAPHLSDGAYVYDGRCRVLSPGEVAARMQTRGGALRVRVPQETVGFTDGCQGYYEQNLATDCGDFILRRSDGVFAYQLAAPADDGDMGVTEVVRGRDLLASAPRQIWLMRTLGYTPPRFCHLPLLLAPDGRRLAKRDQDLDLGALRTRGVRPERLLGALAQLAGILPQPQAVTARELVGVFSWGAVRREDIVLPEGFAQGLG